LLYTAATGGALSIAHQKLSRIDDDFARGPVVDAG
jgi:hypothetical protein